MTMPTPQVPGLEQHVAELERRIRALEGAAGAKPAASAVPVGAWPWNNGDTLLWPKTSSTEWVQLYRWAAVMEWINLDVRTFVVLPAGTTAQIRVIVNNTLTLWTSGIISANGEVETTIDLNARVANDSFRGSTQQIALGAKVLSGPGPVAVLFEKMLFSGPVW